MIYLCDNHVIDHAIHFELLGYVTGEDDIQFKLFGY